MTRNIIITGAMGSGKSTVLKLLKAGGLTVVEEPARETLAEQRSIEDEGGPREKSQTLYSAAIIALYLPVQTNARSAQCSYF